MSESGASYRGLHDSLVNHIGNKTPEIITVCTKNMPWALPKATQNYGRALAVAVHSNVGLMHASMGVFNAWCDRLPMLILGATGPLDAAKRRPWIEWIHTTIDQGSIVRGFTKWDDQPASPEAAVESIRRGVTITNTKPAGPVYVTLDVSIQEQKINVKPTFDDISNFPTPDDVEPPKAALAEALGVLSQAKRPFIFCGRGGRNETEWQNRIKLAERLNARTTTHIKLPAGFPTTHPLFIGETGWRLKGPVLDAIQSADAILMLDWLDGGNTLKLAFPPGSPRPSVINVSNDFQIHRGWSMDYGGLAAVDVLIPTVPCTAVSAFLDGLAKPAPVQQLREWDVPLVSGEGDIGMMDLARAFFHAIKDVIFASPAGHLAGPMPNEITHPHGFLGHTGGGGSCRNISAVGAALGLREIGSGRRAVAILGDGDYTMGLTAIWNAATLKLPILFLIANNQSYYNDEDHQIKIARCRGRPEENASIGQRMQEPEPNLAGLARNLGLEAPEPITNLADLQPAVIHSLDRVENGAAVVLDVRVRQEYVVDAMVELS